MPLRTRCVAFAVVSIGVDGHKNPPHLWGRGGFPEPQPPRRFSGGPGLITAAYSYY